MAKLRKPDPLPSVYFDGRNAYLNHESIDSCPFKSSPHHRTYWLAGWNDADIEHENGIRSLVKSELLSRENRISGEQE